MAERVTLTARMVEIAEAPEAGQRFIRDSELPGFALRITAAGAKSYIVEARVNGRVRRTTLGRADVLDLAKARKLARATLGEFATGNDPVSKRRAERARTATLGEVFDRYIASRSLRPKTLKEYRATVDTLLGDWRERPVVSITRDMVERAHKRITEENGAARANLAMRVLRALLNYAAAAFEDEMGRPIITDNPVKRLTAAKAWNRVERRHTLIQAHQLEDWWRAVERLTDDPRDAQGRLTKDENGRQVRKGRKAEVVRDYLQFLLLTGLRREEAAQLKWEDVNLKARSFTISQTKNHRPHTLPLSDYLFTLLKRRKLDKDRSEYVFPGEGKHGYLVEPRKQMAKVTKESGVVFTLHDLRRTFVTVAERLDIPGYALKWLLNHKSGGDVTAGYIVIDAERLRGPMQQITDYVLHTAEVR